MHLHTRKIFIKYIEFRGVKRKKKDWSRNTAWKNILLVEYLKVTHIEEDKKVRVQEFISKKKLQAEK